MASGDRKHPYRMSTPVPRVRRRIDWFYGLVPVALLALAVYLLAR